MPQTSRQPRLRGSATLVAICVLSGFVFALVQLGLLNFTRRPTRDLQLTVVLANVAALGWTAFGSGFTVRGRVLTSAALVVAQSCIFVSLRIDGYRGDGRPIFRGFWIPTPEAEFAASRTSRSGLPGGVQADFTRPAGTDWPSFRGRDRLGFVSDVQLEHDWQTHPPRLQWRRSIGRGWSSLVGVGDYCVTQEQRADEETVVCYDIRSGDEIWVHADPVRFAETTSGDGPRATPTIHEGRVYSLGATGILNCLRGNDGSVVWSTAVSHPDALVDDATRKAFGEAGSPLIVGDTVVVSPGPLAAYALADGRPRWISDEVLGSYCSPQFARFTSGDQIIYFAGESVSGHDANTGRLLWRFPWGETSGQYINVCQPIPIDPGEVLSRVFISSGYGRGSALLQLTRSDERFTVVPIWQSTKLKAKFASAVVCDQYVYGLDGSILTCLDLATGQARWKGGRYGYGQLILVGDSLLVQAESGEVAMVAATPEGFQELGRFEALSHRTWNHPALVADYLLLRNDREAACFQLALRAP